MRELTTEEIHQVELGLLQALDDFCREHGLTYYLAYGTLLGAIRHDGFIPWDDDADVWLPRKDYDYVVEHFGTQGHYSLIQPYQPAYGFAWAKLLDTRTAYRSDVFILPDDYGLTLDLFPLDGDRGEDVFLRLKKIAKMRAIKWRTLRNNPRPKSWVRAVVRAVVPASLVGEEGFRKVMSAGQSNGKLVCYMTRYAYRQESAPAESFVGAVRRTFEGQYEFPVPVGYEEVLERVYGKNWREPIVSTHKTTVYWRD